MKRRPVFLLLLGFLFILSITPLGAADQIRARADRVTGQLKKEEQETVVLEGNVVITHEKTTIETDRAVYDKTAGTLYCTGRVRLTSEGMEVEAAELLYRRQAKVGTFRNGVVLRRQEEKDKQGQITKDPFTLTCREMVVSLAEKKFTATGEVKIVHAEFLATAEKVVYDDARQELRLSGTPRLIRKDETVEAEEMVIAVAEETFILSRAKIDFWVKDEAGAGTGDVGAGPTDGNKPSGSL